MIRNDYLPARTPPKKPVCHRRTCEFIEKPHPSYTTSHTHTNILCIIICTNILLLGTYTRIIYYRYSIINIGGSGSGRKRAAQKRIRISPSRRHRRGVKNVTCLFNIIMICVVRNKILRWYIHLNIIRIAFASIWSEKLIYGVRWVGAGRGKTHRSYHIGCCCVLSHFDKRVAVDVTLQQCFTIRNSRNLPGNQPR